MEDGNTNADVRIAELGQCRTRKCGELLLFSQNFKIKVDWLRWLTWSVNYCLDVCQIGLVDRYFDSFQFLQR